MNAGLMVHPRAIAKDHTVFVAGDHTVVKSVVSGFLGEFGWRAGEIVDVGYLAAAWGVLLCEPEVTGVLKPGGSVVSANNSDPQIYHLCGKNTVFL